jgi:hypothetical protein
MTTDTGRTRRMIDPQRGKRSHAGGDVTSKRILEVNQYFFLVHDTQLLGCLAAVAVGAED